MHEPGCFRWLVALALATGACGVAQAQAQATSAPSAVAPAALDPPARPTTPESASGAPQPGSLRARALSALDGAEDLTLYSLQPWEPPPSPPQWQDLSAVELSRREASLEQRSRRDWCKRERCFHDQRVLGRTRLAAADRPAVRAALAQALGQVPDASSLCMPSYRHAVSFVSAGLRYEVLLCYQCDQIAVAAGREREAGDSGGLGDRAAVDAILRRAGIALAKSAYDEEE
ncbi:hypothetical protein GLE_4516 [Lysobacter enzymogenes]|uniref:Uncharacterized protein n=1 Tax=Lysobacter enzymogenes TaxID=69 RepID=A0A0S2DMZ6_LYSEN|nr:hypothetical protein [Lysobacter enzymogenes]ALN59857.1 hypothetical protein GLE_4516 [Lysobacter enzymogenes]QCW27927.1 hypothetical protein FE772_22055 [Lysobacter enzymogenes]